jgi:hypothetical protein
VAAKAGQAGALINIPAKIYPPSLCEYMRKQVCHTEQEKRTIHLPLHSSWFVIQTFEIYQLISGPSIILLKTDRRLEI